MPLKGVAKARAPRLPRFSPTKLGAYRACPRAYAFQYDQGLRWDGIDAAWLRDHDQG